MRLRGVTRENTAPAEYEQKHFRLLHDIQENSKEGQKDFRQEDEEKRFATFALGGYSSKISVSSSRCVPYAHRVRLRFQ
jgi:hypothetical protein